jgi:hypothetical protein
MEQESLFGISLLIVRVDNPCVGGSIPLRATKKHQNHLRVVFHLIAYADAHSLNTMRIGIIYIATSPA